MCFCCLYAVKVFQIIVLTGRKLHRADDVLIFFLKHSSILAVGRLTCSVILTIVGNLVNEEQTEHLDALVEKLTLTLNMR